jgi:Kef-type K+ transport system membrane component KefB
MEEFYPFFLVIFAAVFLSTIFRRFNVPWVILMILTGIVIGPHALDMFESNPTIDFLGQIGLIFLMFMAGLEVRFSNIKEFKKDIAVISALNGAIPFLVGVAIGFLFGFGLVASLLLGIIFISSSIAVIIPSLEANKILGKRIGKSIVAATIVEDTASLVLLSILLQTLSPITHLSLPVFYALLLFALVSMRVIIPKLESFLSLGKRSTKDLFQQEVRSVLAVLIGTVIIFEVLGLHPIIAGFFAGLVLSGVITSEALRDKLRTIGYGLFVPIFFIIIGVGMDLSIFSESKGAFLLTSIIVLGSIISKFVGGWLGGKILRFTSSESTLIGVSTIPQLSTTLAVVFTGVTLNLLPENLMTAMVILSIITVFIAPILTRICSRRILEVSV